MNSQQPNYMDAHAMSASQQYASHASTANSMSQYPAYQHHQSTPVMPHGQAQYAQSPASYAPQYGYPSMPSPHSNSSVPSSMSHVNHAIPPPLQGGQQPYVGASAAPAPATYSQHHDPSGQIAPAGMKPRVTATLWEDEGCMCFQVETKGVCVARRDDNHMVNGTKLLNVAGMTRGRRDGILKSEKTRHVVKIGPMHLKGVWIPFERALDFANKEKITDSLYPLFVHNIGALLYQPQNANRNGQVMAPQQERRRQDKQLQGGMPSVTQSPSMTHHPSMNSSAGNQQPSIAPNSAAGRPGIDRAHTFPTPPTSASGTMTSIGSGPGSYDWTNGAMSGGVQPGQAMTMENHPHSTPATPATTPPGSALPSLQPYQGQSQMYGGQPTHQNQYPSQAISRSGSLPSAMYHKQEMGPPSRLIGSRPESEHGDVKLDPYGQAGNPENAQPGVDTDPDHEQDADYQHSNAQAYGSHRGSFDAYHAASNLASYANAGDVNGSANVNGGSGRATPRAQAQWATGYNTPPHAPPAGTLYNPTSDARGSLANGSSNGDSYVTGPYAPTQVNGLKRGREDDDTETMKRQKMAASGSSTMMNGSYDTADRPFNRARPVSQKAGRVR